MTTKAKRRASRSRMTIAQRHASATAELQRLADRDPVVKLGMRLGWLHAVSGGLGAAKATDSSDDCAVSRLQAIEAEENAIEEMLTCIPATTMLGARIQLRLADVLLWCLAEPGPNLDVTATVHKVQRLMISAYRALDNWAPLSIEIERDCLGNRLPHPQWPFPQEWGMEKAAERMKANEKRLAAAATQQEGGAS